MVRTVAVVITAMAALAWAAAQSPSDADSTASTSTESSRDSEPTAPSALRWTQCEGLAAGFECATLAVPICHDGSCSSADMLDLTVTRYEEGTGDDAPSVWVLSDYADVNDIETQMETIALQAKANVYTVMSRWQALPRTYGGSKSACGQLVDTFETRNPVDSPYLSAVEDCQTWLAEAYGSAAVYSTDNAAKDLHLALTTIQQQVIKSKTSKTFLYAARSSTRIVQRLIALDIKDTVYSIAGYIYENPQLMSLPSNFDKLQGDVVSTFMSSCASDALCSSKFKSIGTSMESILKTTYEAFDTTSSESSLSQCALMLKQKTYDSNRDLTPSDGARRWLAWMMADAKSSAQAIAPILYRLHRCSKQDQSRLDKVFSQASELRNRNRYFAEAAEGRMVRFVERIVLTSELWPTPTPSQTELSKSLSSTLGSEGVLQLLLPAYCAFTGVTTGNCASLYKSNADLSKPAKITYTSTSKTEIVGAKADVLILASRLGLGGSVDAAEQLYKAYTGAGGGQTSVLVVSDSLDGSEFARDLAATSQGVFDLFVTGNAKQLTGKWHTNDLRSLDSTPSQSTYETAPVSVNFTIVNDKRGWFSRSDPWEGDDELDFGTGSYGSWGGLDDIPDPCISCVFGLGALWWLLVIACVLLLGAGVFVVIVIRHQRERSRRQFERDQERRRRLQEQLGYDHAQQIAVADPAYGFQTPSTLNVDGPPSLVQPSLSEPQPSTTTDRRYLV